MFVAVLASESYLTLMRDPAHWLFEITVEIVTGLVITWPIRRFVRHHDRRVHGTRR
jgi:hypothetical protein